MIIVEVNDTLLRLHANEASIARGRDCQEDGMVINLSFEKPHLIGEVEGGRADPYRVKIHLNREGNRWTPDIGECSCPYDDGGWCQHIVAVLLQAQTKPEELLEEETLAARIQALTESQSKALLLKLAEQRGMREQIQAHLPTRVTDSDQVARDVKRHVFNAVRSLRGMRSSQAYWHIGEVVNSLRPHLDTAQDLLDDDETEPALQLLVALVDAYMEVWTELDDSDGEVSGFLDEVSPLLVETLLASNLTDTERQALLPGAQKWNAEAQDYGVESLQAVVKVLQSGVEGVHTLRAENHTALDPIESIIATAWLTILFRRQLSDQYLRYSEQTGHHAAHAAYLVSSEAIQDGIRYGQAHSLNPEGALMLINALADQGACREAVEFGLDVLNQSTGSVSSLARRVGELADSIGDFPAGWTAHFRAFAQYPTAEHYAHLKDRAGSKWSQQAERLWEVLRTKASVQVATDVFLREGMIDDALAACNRSSWLSPDILENVGSAAVAARPDWVIERLSQEALSIIKAGKAPHYRQAVRLLMIVRDAYRSQGNDAGWTALKSNLLTQHARKYALVPLINPL